MFPCGREFGFGEMSEDEQLYVMSEGETPSEGEGNEQGGSEESRFFRVEPSEHC